VNRPSLKLAAMAALTVAVTACSGTAPEGSQGDDGDATDTVSVVLNAVEAAEMLDARDDLQIIDVRTPAEFGAGHLADAQLVDVQDPSFVEQLEALEPHGAYLVYCRTGNRSAQAVSTMRDMGFTELYDGGGLADLASAGAPVVVG